MLNRDYPDQNCPVAASLEVIGERWTLLILRDVFLGHRRFDAIQARLGIARNVLRARLTRLVQAGVLRRERYQERPDRYEYRLTDKGRALWPVIVSLVAWGNEHVIDGPPPMFIEHRDCGGRVDDRRRCTGCGRDLELRDVVARRVVEAPRAAAGSAAVGA